MATILTKIAERGGKVLESEGFSDPETGDFAFTVVFLAAGEVWVADGSQDGVKIQSLADKAIENLGEFC